MSTTSSPKCNGILPVTATAISLSSPTPTDTAAPPVLSTSSNDSIHENDNNGNDNVHPLIQEMPLSPSLSSVASDTLSITDVIDISK
jgi:hypothetical protein